MHLIVEIPWDVPYVASGTETRGVEYESVEKFEYDLELLVEEILADKDRSALKDGNLIFAGLEFEFCEMHYFYKGKNEIKLPDVYTVDDWFKKELKERKG